MKYYTEDEIVQIVEREFPFTFFATRTFSVTLATEQFGPRAVTSLVFGHGSGSRVFVFDPTKRWALWNYPRFRFETDMVMAKMMFG